MCTITCTWVVFSLHIGEECAAYCILICQGYMVFKNLMEVKVLVIDNRGATSGDISWMVPIVALSLFDVLHTNHRRSEKRLLSSGLTSMAPSATSGDRGCRVTARESSSRSKADPRWSMMASPWMWLCRRADECTYWPWLQTGHHPPRRLRTQVILIVGSEGPSGTTRPERDWWNPQGSL
jgi:hypothetical protein